MSIFRKLNPFRRRCCEVPLIMGNYETPGEVVTGIASVDGHDFDFIGVMLGDGIDHGKVCVDLDALLPILEKAGSRGAWNEDAA